MLTLVRISGKIASRRRAPSVFGVPLLIPLLEVRLQPEQAGAEQWGDHREDAKHYRVHLHPLQVPVSKLKLRYTSG
jgi:hypothetical protein